MEATETVAPAAGPSQRASGTGRLKLAEVKEPLPSYDKREKFFKSSMEKVVLRLFATAMLSSCQFALAVFDQNGKVKAWATPDVIPLFLKDWVNIQKTLPACIYQSQLLRRLASVDATSEAKLSDIPALLLAKACVSILDTLVPKRAFSLPWKHTTWQRFKEIHTWYPLERYDNFQEASYGELEAFVIATLKQFPGRTEDIASAAAAVGPTITQQEALRYAILNCSKELDIAPYRLPGVLSLSCCSTCLSCMHACNVVLCR